MMKHFFIKLKDKEKLELLSVISKKLKIKSEDSKKLIEQGSVWDNDKKVRLKDPKRIIDNELLSIYIPEFPIIKYSLLSEDIVYEDSYFICVYKKKGVNSCPSPFSDIDCIVNGVQKYFDSQSVKYTVSPINRLDSPTDGLLLFAKDKNTERYLHSIFKERKIRKLYIARTPLFEERKESYYIKDILHWKDKPQEAISYIKFLFEKNRTNYFCVYLLTGRTHQIRKHFKKYLSPIIGDSLYGNYKRDDDMQLSCYYYKFKHPATSKDVELNIYDKIISI